MRYFEAEGELRQLPIPAPGGPEEFFAQEFARSLFGLAVDRLRSECEEKGKALHFQLLELYDIEEGGKQLTYDEVARRFGIKATDVTNYLSFARKQFRRIVLEELRAMTSSEEEFRRAELIGARRRPFDQARDADAAAQEVVPVGRGEPGRGVDQVVGDARPQQGRVEPVAARGEVTLYGDAAQAGVDADE